MMVLEFKKKKTTQKPPNVKGSGKVYLFIFVIFIDYIREVILLHQKIRKKKGKIQIKLIIMIILFLIMKEISSQRVIIIFMLYMYF
jgi:hypothetical protein